MSRPLLFYSAWPLGYHNVEAERKARAFAAAGFDVVYVAGIGIRNPRLSSAAKLVDRIRRKLHAGAVEGSQGLRTASVLVVPPRQLRAVRRSNASWMERQLRAAIDTWPDAVAWIRWPTPELVDVLPRLGPAATVYECVDAYRHTPGITGRWTEIFDAAERSLVETADVVVAPSEALAARLRALGGNVRVVPHGVDPLFRAVARRPRSGPVSIGFAGTLDYRLDLAVLRRVAADRPEWRLRLVGPAQEGFQPATLGGLSNVTVEPPVPYERLPELLATFDVGIMPYVEHPVYEYMTPVKLLELLAVGVPVVARPSPAFAEFESFVYRARTPGQFVGAVEQAVSEDTRVLREARRAATEHHTWDRRFEELQQVLEEIGAAP